MSIVVILLSVLFLLSYLWVFVFHDKAMDYIERKGKKMNSQTTKSQEGHALGTINGIGGSFFGFFRYSTDPFCRGHVAYNFFSLLSGDIWP